MKKLFLFASAAALLATSCSDDLGFKNQQQSVVEGNTTLLAEFPIDGGSDIETRTELENNGTGKKYVWVGGDAIGVFNAYGDGTTNAKFSYSTTSGSTATFIGDYMALAPDGLVAYYPYYSGANFDNETSELPLTISQYQNYNHMAVGNGGFTLTPPSGSFSSGDAPAVAYGEFVGESTMRMKFQSLASYLVFPIQAFNSSVTINSLTLQITESGEAYTAGSEKNKFQQIAGSFGVDMNYLANSGVPKMYEMTEPATSEDDAPATDDLTTIYLNCGRGVVLNPSSTATKSANFWFVIPACTELTNATVVVTVNGIVNGKNATYVITKNLGSNAPAQAGMDKLWKVTPVNNTPWTFNNTSVTNGYTIATQSQFLEYVYLVTNGAPAIQEWAMMKGQGGNLGLSDIQNMLVYAEGKTASNILAGMTAAEIWGPIVTAVKPAVIVAPIDLNPTTLSSQLGITANTPVQDYYQYVYQNFIKNGGYIAQPIGGCTTQALTASISGASSDITISNLKVNGSALFTVNSGSGFEASKTVLKDLTLVNASIKPASTNNIKYFNLLANNSGTGAEQYSFSGVTVTSGSVEGLPENATAGLFAQDQSSWYTYSSTSGWSNSNTGVTNNTTNLLFANELNINSARVNSNGYPYDYNFAQAGLGISNFNKIYLQGYAAAAGMRGYGAVLNIAKQNSAAESEQSVLELQKALNLVKMENALLPYSIIDGSTSYWTGTVYSADNAAQAVPGTAEYLATLVQNGKVANTLTSFTSTGYALDLMGKVNGKVQYRWFTKGQASQNYISINGKYIPTTDSYNPLVINNVFIDGTTDGENIYSAGLLAGNTGTYNYLTLFGNYANANNVTVNGIEISPADAVTDPATCYLQIGAIASHLQGVSTNLNVNNMVLNVGGLENLYGYNQSYDTGVAGGLYCELSNAALTPGTNGLASLTSVSVEPKVGGFSGFNNVGYIAGVLNYTVTTNSATVYNPSKAVATRTPFGVFNLIVNPTNSRISTTVDLSQYPYFAGYDELATINIINGTTSDNALGEGYTVYMKVADGKRYIWEYNTANKKFVYGGYLVK